MYTFLFISTHFYALVCICMFVEIIQICPFLGKFELFNILGNKSIHYFFVNCFTLKQKSNWLFNRFFFNFLFFLIINHFALVLRIQSFGWVPYNFETQSWLSFGNRINLGLDFNWNGIWIDFKSTLSIQICSRNLYCCNKIDYIVSGLNCKVWKRSKEM